MVAGEPYTGLYTREIPTEVEAEEFIRDIEHKHLIIHYDPRNPSRSSLLDIDIDLLLQQRAPASFALASPNDFPQWVMPFLPILLALSVIGLILSLWIHLGSVRGQQLAPSVFFWGLHAGIFVVWFPAIFIAQKLVGNVNRSDFWKMVLRNCHPWMRYVVYGFSAYAVINFLLFLGLEAMVSKSSDVTPNVWRGFSGHWMAFYSAAAAIFYSAISFLATKKDH